MKGGETDMEEKTFLTVDEVAEILTVSKSKAYEIVRQLNKELKEKGLITVVRKYTNLTELTPEIVHEFIDKIIVHAPDKSSGKRLQEIEIIYNHIGVFDHSKVTLWKGKAV